jgi:hypothetical protein
MSGSRIPDFASLHPGYMLDYRSSIL